MEIAEVSLFAICIMLLAIAHALKAKAAKDVRYGRIQLALLIIAAIACVVAMICGIKFVSAGAGPHLQR
jgi:hypothetical protein